MSSHADTATQLFKQGYNCAQAVFAAFCDETGLDMKTALLLSSPFGGGMGRLREVCGAVTGTFLVAGIKYGYTDPKDNSLKAEHYRLIQTIALKFQEKNGSYICRELRGLEKGADNPVPETRTNEYYQTRPCADLVACAADILDELIKNEGTVTGWMPEV